MKRLSLGGTLKGDIFSGPMNRYHKWKARAKKASKDGDLDALFEAHYWMREYELQIEALGGLLLAAAVPPNMIGVTTDRMLAAQKELKARKKLRKRT